jgi:hypothetical protein
MPELLFQLDRLDQRNINIIMQKYECSKLNALQFALSLSVKSFSEDRDGYYTGVMYNDRRAEKMRVEEVPKVAAFNHAAHKKIAADATTCRVVLAEESRIRQDIDLLKAYMRSDSDNTAIRFALSFTADAVKSLSQNKNSKLVVFKNWNNFYKIEAKRS